MELFIEEMRNSWAHCKELIASNAQLDLVIAFLEDFKEQFTAFYRYLKTFRKTTAQTLSLSLVDSAFVFWKKEGELSVLIRFVKHNWSAKKHLLKRIHTIDKIITTILSHYAATTPQPTIS